MASNPPYHDCDLCRPIIERILTSHSQNVQDGISHPQSIDTLGSLDAILEKSATCRFHNFILRLHDQVRPSYAIAPVRGMPVSSAKNHKTSEVRARLDLEDTQKTPSGKCQVWSCHVDFVERVEDVDVPVRTKWRAMFRLVADDLKYIQRDASHDPVDLGRLLDPSSACDPQFWKECFTTCLEQHTDTCSDPQERRKNSLLPRSMRVIDLVDLMIKPLPQDSDYAVMSYVWGVTNFLRLTSDNFETLTKPGSLWDVEKPKTIYDAMLVAQSLGIRYLWIDALCIIQDSDQDKMEQVHRMGQIYTNAVLTIVGSRSGHADGGLWSSEHRSQIIGEGGGLRWLSAAPTLPHAVKLSAWAKRAWTYQEAAFSRRALVFTEHQAYYTCRCSAWAEDYVRCISNDRNVLEYRSDQDQSSRTIEAHTTYPRSWSHLLKQYTNRRLTFESDVLIASAGVVASYLSSHHDVAICGMPVSMLFEYGLLWMPVVPLTRRRIPPPGKGFMFPSWSWAGWSGAVNYDRSDHFLRPVLDAARVVKKWNFQCDDLKTFLSNTQLLRKHDHYLDSMNKHTPGTVSFQTVQQGTLIFNTLVARLDVGLYNERGHWNQFMDSEDNNCLYTGYYKLYDKQVWIGSIHLEHTVAKQLMQSKQEVLVMSTTGGQGPTYVTPLPHINDPDDTEPVKDPVWLPLCDPSLITEEDDEMFNVMLVRKKDDHHGKGRYRVGVGQVHKKSFEELWPRQEDFWLE